MKCFKCNQQAIVVMQGRSYCKECQEKEKWWLIIIILIVFIWVACLIWEGQKTNH